MTESEPTAGHEDRAEPVVVVDATAAGGVARCVAALLEHTSAATPLVVGGSAGGAERAATLLAAAGRAHELRSERGAALIAAVAAARPGHDLALISGATEVTSGWLPALASAANRSRGEIASVTALSSAAAFISVPHRNLPAPLLAEHTTDDAAPLVAAAAGGACVPIPAALPHAALLTAAALALVGHPDPDETDSGEALAAWSARATAAGLRHLCATGVYVGHRGELGGWSIGAWPQRAGDQMVEAVDDAALGRGSALERALLRVSVALEPLTVTVDARCLATEQVTGTVHLVVELLGALAEREDLRVRALLPDRVGRPSRGALERMHGLDTVLHSEQMRAPVRTQVAHRPWQVETPDDLALLDLAGERIVITHQDLIAYRTPDNFAGVGDWREYRSTTRQALAVAAAVCCSSQAAADDLLADDLVDRARLQIAPLGGRAGYLPQVAASLPAQIALERPYLVLLGSRFRHKNSWFAMELLRALREHHRWDGDLVLAGAEVAHGSATDQDAEWRIRNREHAGAVIDLGPIGEAEKLGLLGAAAAVLYPSTYEGFGLIPFEAAASGVPCAFAAVSAQATLLPRELALIEPWDAAASAARIAPLLVAGEPRERFVDQMRRACEPYTWERTAECVVAAYRGAIAAPAPAAAQMTQELARATRQYWLVRDRIPDAIWRLIDPERPLLAGEQAEQLADALADQDRRARIERALSPQPPPPPPPPRRWRRLRRR